MKRALVDERAALHLSQSLPCHGQALGKPSHQLRVDLVGIDTPLRLILLRTCRVAGRGCLCHQPLCRIPGSRGILSQAADRCQRMVGALGLVGGLVTRLLQAAGIALLHAQAAQLTFDLRQ